VPFIIDFDEQLAVLRCWGDEDRGTQGRRRHAVTRALSSRADVVVDLGALSFADTTLMLDLVMLARRLRRHGRALRLRCPQPQIERLIELVGLHRLEGVIIEPAPPDFAVA
jgi:anti-anti-sigma factor